MRCDGNGGTSNSFIYCFLLDIFPRVGMLGHMIDPFSDLDNSTQIIWGWKFDLMLKTPHTGVLISGDS